MSQIRKISVRRFRGIKHLDWAPRPGLNAILGAGDVGKSTVLDAIAFTLSSTRREVFYDTDFHRLNVEGGFEINITVGELPQDLHDIDRYGDYLRGWSSDTSSIVDEPEVGLEDVLTLRLSVGSDLEGQWSLFSERTGDRDPRDLSLAHRALLAPVVLGHSPATHLRWARHSILQRLAEPQFAIRTLVARAARGLREQGREAGGDDLAEVVEQVRGKARELGIRPGQEAQVLLDAFGIPGWNASLALHDNEGVPLRRLGTGSSRLLVAGLFHSRIAPTGIALVDEAELGLEPHRTARFLRLLGAGSDAGPQVFITTHSPVVVRELRAHELAIAHVGPVFEVHEINNVADVHMELDIQALVRANAESFLASAVVVAEGATEIGLVRGLDHYWSSQGQDPLALAGISIANGGGIPQAASRATAYAKLGYRTILLMDDDRPLTGPEREPIEEAGVTVISWGAGHATEQALFHGLSWPSVQLMLDIAAEFWDIAHLETCVHAISNGAHSFNTCRAQDLPAHRDALALAAQRYGWFKRIEFGERVGQDVVGPGWVNATASLQATVTKIFEQTRSGQNG